MMFDDIPFGCFPILLLLEILLEHDGASPHLFSELESPLVVLLRIFKSVFQVFLALNVKLFHVRCVWL